MKLEQSGFYCVYLFYFGLEQHEVSPAESVVQMKEHYEQ